MLKFVDKAVEKEGKKDKGRYYWWKLAVAMDKGR